MREGEIFYVCARCSKYHTEFAAIKRHIIGQQPYRSELVCVNENECLQRITNKRLHVNVDQLALFPTFHYMTTGALLG